MEVIGEYTLTRLFITADLNLQLMNRTLLFFEVKIFFVRKEKHPT
jgi:hypothetical protein